MSRTLLKWVGGKYFLRRKLLNLIPPHHCYVEVFGGAGNLLFLKLPSRVEVYNDIDSDLVNLFRVLRDEDKFKKFQLGLELTLYSREEYLKAEEKYKDRSYVDDVERACIFFYLTNCGLKGFRSGFHTETKINRARTYFNRIEGLTWFHERLRNVIIENRDYKDILGIYDGEDTFFYLDPPYLARSSDKNYYSYEMKTEEEHIELCKRILKLKGKVLLSGYDNSIYNEMLNGWYSETFLSESCAGWASKDRTRVIEKVWFNYPKAGNLFRKEKENVRF